MEGETKVCGPGPLAYESGALLTALRGPATKKEGKKVKSAKRDKALVIRGTAMLAIDLSKNKSHVVKPITVIVSETIMSIMYLCTFKALDHRRETI